MLLLKNLNDGRRVLVYNDYSEKDNIIALIRENFSPITEIMKFTDEEERWRDELPIKLGVTREELNI